MARDLNAAPEPGLRPTGLHKLDRQSQPSRRGYHSRELQDQTFTFCRRFGTAGIFSSLHHALDRFSVACDRAGMRISTKIPRCYVSPQTLGSICGKCAEIYCSRWRSNAERSYLRVTEGGARRFIHGLVKLTQFCVSLSLCGHKTGAFKHRSAVSFKIGLCSDLYLWS